MPNYEYQCKSCDHRFEIWQPVGEAAPACESCGQEVKKVFQPPRIHFKGSGFYVTDLAAEKKGKTASTTETKSETPAASETAAPSSDTTATPAASPAKTETATV